MKSEVLETRFATFTNTEMYLKVVYKDNISISYENAIEIVTDRINFTKNKKHKNINCDSTKN